MLALAKKFEGFFKEIKQVRKLEVGSVVCFYHADDYLGRGVIIEIHHDTATIQLDSLAMKSYNIYHNRLFDFMILDEEVEKLFDEY